eukprot:CAMPEP_0181207686 /NCGR_PEP_ID=MMETSP1096-20121128/21716_1 /TAXON_ID=156174 ORGANISM="Chrysochromulina ericina, Strain CCMP281" /NCGR_SAMPLE_ID=MMETSP1096 /ASSEMBLY_ACC=CAM_ASM_000453 /LENGTH=185 /DNA_ID=CAMNT_0023298699 /DNA_START=432 /DNA_END=989 /DNA_ORIENTATION=-
MANLHLSYAFVRVLHQLEAVVLVLAYTANSLLQHTLERKNAPRRPDARAMRTGVWAFERTERKGREPDLLAGRTHARHIAAREDKAAVILGRLHHHATLLHVEAVHNALGWGGVVKRDQHDVDLEREDEGAEVVPQLCIPMGLQHTVLRAHLVGLWEATDRGQPSECGHPCGWDDEAVGGAPRPA